MARVVFVVHPERPPARELANQAITWLDDRGHQGRIHGEGPAGTSRDLTGSNLAVSLGGDGTMLRTVVLASRSGVPVLGVDFGRLGYLTEVEPSGLDSALERFLSGRFTLEERMTLSVEIQSNSRSTSLLALNEAAIEKTEPGHTIRVATSIGGKHFVTYTGDGLIVATPTGSTAYNLSVRGPVVSPSVRAFVLTPVAPHLVFDRSLVLDTSEWLRMELVGPRPAALVIDGQTVAQIHPGDVVECRKGEHPARLVTFGQRDFHAILRDRFHLANTPES